MTPTSGRVFAPFSALCAATSGAFVAVVSGWHLAGRDARAAVWTQQGRGRALEGTLDPGRARSRAVPVMALSPAVPRDRWGGVAGTMAHVDEAGGVVRSTGAEAMFAAEVWCARKPRHFKWPTNSKVS